MLEPFYQFGGRRWAFDRSYQPVPLEAQAAIRAIECENIFGRYSHIRWLFWTEVPYSHAKMAPDNGITARVFGILNELAIDAIRAGTERITDEDIESWKPILEGETMLA